MITVVGLEIHAELLTETKIFCGCKNAFGGEENERVCPVCMGFPGSLPTLNEKAVRLAVKAGKALGCEINNYSAFDRKNYFYPDLPKAYQITQFEYPICGKGRVDMGKKSFGITRIHLEEDAGKLVHEGKLSRADYNRCGVPLVEIVTEPDFRSGEEAAAFAEEIAGRLKFCGVCDGRMEQGSLRVDVNISVMPEEASELGVRTEIKNLNSYKSIRKAIEYEARRQTEIISSGGKIVRETMRFDGEKTISMRAKESAEDYRYFPEPDIKPIFLTDEEIAEITIPSLPYERKAQYVSRYGLSEEDAALLVKDKSFSDMFETAALHSDGRELAKLMLGSYSRELNGGEEGMVTAQMLAHLTNMITENKISKNSANELMKIIFKTGEPPFEAAQKYNMLMSERSDECELAAKAVAEENPQAVKDFLDGNKKSFGYLMGRLMEKTGKGTNPKIAKEALQRVLDGLMQM